MPSIEINVDSMSPFGLCQKAEQEGIDLRRFEAR